jgi:hypothetical protein
VAKAMLMGSGGIGGRKYQITAVLLTYMAVSLSAIPIYIHQMKNENAGAKPQRAQQAPKAEPAASESNAGETAEPGSQAAPSEETQKPAMPFFAAMGLLVGIGLASPFLELADPVHGIIGLVILFVGMNIAWRMTAGSAKAAIEGPYTA